MIGIGVFHSLDYNESPVNPPQTSVHRIFGQRIIGDLIRLEMNPRILKNLKDVYYGSDDLKKTLHIPEYSFCGYYAFLAVVKFQ